MSTRETFTDPSIEIIARDVDIFQTPEASFALQGILDRLEKTGKNYNICPEALIFNFMDKREEHVVRGINSMLETTVRANVQNVDYRVLSKGSTLNRDGGNKVGVFYSIDYPLRDEPVATQDVLQGVRRTTCANVNEVLNDIGSVFRLPAVQVVASPLLSRPYSEW